VTILSLKVLKIKEDYIPQTVMPIGQPNKEKIMKLLCSFLFPLSLLMFISCKDSTSPKPERVVSWVFNRSYDLGGDGDGQFDLMTGLAVDLYHNIYISDINNNRVQKLTDQAEYITKWGVSGTRAGEFNWPRGVAIDSRGDVYVADQNNYRIQKFGAGGRYIGQVGTQGTNPGQFGYVFSLTTDTNDDIFVVDRENRRIQKFGSNLAYKSNWTYTYTTSDARIASDSEDNIYIVLVDPDTSTNAMVVKYDNSGTLITSWTFLVTEEEYFSVRSIAVDSNDRIHTVMSNNTFYVFNSEGKLLFSWDDEDYSEGDFTSIGHIAFDDEDNLYCTDTITNENCVLHIFEKVVTER
jgi:tripartite motif-containing protein 71